MADAPVQSYEYNKLLRAQKNNIVICSPIKVYWWVLIGCISFTLVVTVVSFGLDWVEQKIEKNGMRWRGGILYVSEVEKDFNCCNWDDESQQDCIRESNKDDGHEITDYDVEEGQAYYDRGWNHDTCAGCGTHLEDCAGENEQNDCEKTCLLFNNLHLVGSTYVVLGTFSVIGDILWMIILIMLLNGSTFGPFWVLLVLPWTIVTVQGTAVLMYFGVVLFSNNMNCEGEQAADVCMQDGVFVSVVALLSLSITAVLNHFVWCFIKPRQEEHDI